MPLLPDPERPDAALLAARRRHWRSTRRLSCGLLCAWWLVAFVPPWFARDLDAPFFGWPFSFWAAAQGGVIAFVVLLVVYVLAMRRIDRRLRDEAGPKAPPPTPRRPR